MEVMINLRALESKSVNINKKSAKQVSETSICNTNDCRPTNVGNEAPCTFPKSFRGARDLVVLNEF